MRKGLWSPDEDERLVRCITKYVNGSWSDIARKAGLDRCGKSCRRRWMNHLRPDLKRGKFSMEEIHLIVKLQEALGNRWSDIASHLEGRTDNDIKNLWNTQIKKRLAQLKAAQNSSSSDLSSLLNVNHEATYAKNSSGSMHMLEKTIETGCSEFRDSFGDDLVIRFGNNMSGLLEYGSSCSASSGDGYGTEESVYNQEKNSLYWKPNVNASLEAYENPIQTSSSHAHNLHSVYNRRFSTDDMNIPESEAADQPDSLMLIRPGSSRSSSIHNPTPLYKPADFTQPHDHVLADDDEDFGGHTTAATSASLQSSTTSYHFTVVKPDNTCAHATGPIIPISPNHSKSHIKHSLQSIDMSNNQQAYLSKDQQTDLSNDLFDPCTATDRFKCSPDSIKCNDSLEMNTNSDPRPMDLQTSGCFGLDPAQNVVTDVSINYLNASNDAMNYALLTSGASAANYINLPGDAKKCDNHLPLTLEDTAPISIAGSCQNSNQQQSIIHNYPQGWDMMGETARSSNYNMQNLMPQLSYVPDWCKHLLMQGDLL
ncbi:hypothetical protein L7F22_024791 [Adiantum nelumboides]|nr:hypothetical protein [Adiantum nelumboides]